MKNICITPFNIFSILITMVRVQPISRILKFKKNIIRSLFLHFQKYFLRLKETGIDCKQSTLRTFYRILRLRLGKKIRDVREQVKKELAFFANLLPPPRTANGNNVFLFFYICIMYMDIYMFLKPPISDKENYIKKKNIPEKKSEETGNLKRHLFRPPPLIGNFCQEYNIQIMLRVQLASDNKVSQISL